MITMCPDATLIRDQAAGKWRELLTRLGLTLPRTASQHGPCPTCGGKDRFRFDDQEGRGSWFCNQCLPHAGDGFDLLMNMRECDFPNALQLVATVLGQHAVSPARPPAPAKANALSLKSIWETTVSDTGRVAAYLRHRGLSCGVPASLRWHGSLEYWDADSSTLATYPAMVAAVVNLQGDLTGIHRTWLAQDGDGKAPVSVPKKSLGILTGSTIRLAPHKLGTPLIVSEGIETGLACQEATSWPGWACVSAAGLEAVQLPAEATDIYIAVDLDRSGAGERSAATLAHRLHLEGRTVHLVTPLGPLPAEGKSLDWLNVFVTDGRAAVHAAFDRATPMTKGCHDTHNAIPPYREGAPHESHFHPIAASALLAEPPEAIKWILDDYLPAGGLVLLAGKPKEGKTTLSYEIATKVAQGVPFLGRQTRQGAVLILALEEHARDVRIRLHHLGASTQDGVFVHTGPLAPTATALDEVMVFATEHGVTLILIDTLSAFWKIRDENDAAEMTKVVKPLLQLARESGACVLLIHHARKSEGSYGDEIRGSGALFAAVDVALIMKRHAVQTQRILQAQSRYVETPSELVLELRDSGYVALGDPASAGKAARVAQLTESLSQEWEEAATIAKRAGLSLREGHRLLTILVGEGKALQDGKGKKGSPYRFMKNAMHVPPPPYRHESNDTHADAMHVTHQAPCTHSNAGDGNEDGPEPEGRCTEEIVSDDH